MMMEQINPSELSRTELGQEACARAASQSAGAHEVKSVHVSIFITNSPQLIIVYLHGMISWTHQPRYFSTNNPCVFSISKHHSMCNSKCGESNIHFEMNCINLSRCSDPIAFTTWVMEPYGVSSSNSLTRAYSFKWRRRRAILYYAVQRFALTASAGVISSVNEIGSNIISSPSE